MTAHEIPTDVPRWLEGLPADRAVLMLVRHSVRGPIPHGDAGNDVPLTQHGETLATELGRLIGQRIGRVVSSPVGRCVATAARLVEGSGATRTIGLSRMLGNPGVFVVDGAAAWPNWLQRRNAGMMEHLMTADPPLPGLAVAGEAARQLVHYMLTETGAEPGVHVFVTHDAVLLPTVAQLQGRILPSEDWPGFLDAAFLWIEDGRLVVCYRTRRHELALPVCELTLPHAVELARREVGATIGHDPGAHFFVAGGLFKTLLTGRPAADLDLWAATPADRELLIDRLLKRGAQHTPGQFADVFRIHDRIVEVPHRADAPTLAERLARFDLALSAVGVEHRADGTWHAMIHPLALESVRRREVLLLKPLVNWKYALATLERMRRYADELGYTVPTEDEAEVWRVFDEQDDAMKRGMIERYLRNRSGGFGVHEEIVSRLEESVDPTTT